MAPQSKAKMKGHTIATTSCPRRSECPKCHGDGQRHSTYQRSYQRLSSDGKWRRERVKAARYRCPGCGHFFTPAALKTRVAPHARFAREVVQLAVAHRQKGLSLRKVCDALLQGHNIRVTPATVAKWCEDPQRFGGGLVSTTED